MKGGDLFWLWAPYELYGQVDAVYSRRFFEQGNGFTSAQGLLNVVESILNFAYLGLEANKSPIAVLVGFTTVLLTFWKTVLYWLQDQQCGWCLTGHNDRGKWWLLFAIPNGFWLVAPLAIACVFGAELAQGLRFGAKAKVL
ncbi:hypothetical protein OIV83_002362 [Microbotryomycetes sp. JL201]|nr:hypothetical protein OIV83_002362 [Microbotryomycetes sp. JL201]